MSYQPGENSTRFNINDEYLQVFRGLPAAHSKAYQHLVAFYSKYPEATLAALPAIASELSEAIGFSSMLDFFQQNHAAKAHVQPGCSFFTRLKLETSPVACNHILQISDNDNYVYLPSGSGIYMALKRAAVQLAVKHNINSREIIAFFGISNRHLRNIKG